MKITIGFSIQDTFQSKFIALFQRFRIVEKKGVLKSLYLSTKYALKPLEYLIKNSILTEEFNSHVFIIFNVAGNDFLVESDNILGIAVRSRDFLDGNTIYRMFEYDVDEEEFFWRLFLAFSIETSEKKKRKLPIGYDWGDILSFIVPFIRGSKNLFICSEFVYFVVFASKYGYIDYVITPYHLYQIVKKEIESENK